MRLVVAKAQLLVFVGEIRPELPLCATVKPCQLRVGAVADQSALTGERSSPGLEGLDSSMVWVVESPPIELVTDTWGFENLHRAKYPGLVAVARAMTGGRCDGEDLMQDTMVKAFVQWSRVGRPQPPRTAVALYLAGDHTAPEIAVILGTTLGPNVRFEHHLPPDARWHHRAGAIHPHLCLRTRDFPSAPLAVRSYSSRRDGQGHVSTT